MSPAPSAKLRVSRLSRRARRLHTLAWVGLVGGYAGLCAADSHTTVQVTANVMPVARMEILGADQPLRIGAADLARGFIDAPRPLQLRVYSNSRAGFALEIMPLSPLFTAVALQGFDTPVTLGAAGGTVVQRWQGAQSRSLTLRLRFTLPAALQPGLYAWPLQFAARAL